ncbi:hypothetical protein BLA17378_02935 [Burkholderia aenigmatica]|uniref:Transposase n=1 Tax=Burkholderia aenigmatica TaxID=2015348 RepID=A0ABY6XUK7_9BURK|nr:hypothetical protein BLA17378_02935 [Burkholderia aenigmatica]
MPGRHLKAHLEIALAGWPDLSNQIAQRRAGADIPHGPNLAKRTLDAQVRKLAHTFGDVVDERIEHARLRCAWTITRRLGVAEYQLMRGVPPALETAPSRQSIRSKPSIVPTFQMTLHHSLARPAYRSTTMPSRLIRFQTFGTP